MLNDNELKSRFPSEPLAIVGMACRLPGADNLDGFWDLLRDGKSGITEVPADRMDRRLYLTSEPGTEHKSYSSISGMIPPRPGDPSCDYRKIDTDQLLWDPCHEILCGVVDEARQHAGWSTEQMSSARTGVYVGHSCGSALGGEIVLASNIPEVADTLGQLPEFQNLSAADRQGILSEFVDRIQHQRPVRKAGQPLLEANFAAQLIALRMQLVGPQMVIDAACASSLVALGLASAALTKGEIDQAIVSSASYMKTDSLILFSLARSCSARGSRPFDAEADGLVNAEGYIAVIVKTLARARTDGDKIHAIIRGIGISTDGRGRSLWAPRKEGQLEAVRRAYSGSVTKESVQYIEAHATSTQVGDATELEALGAYFQAPQDQQKIPLGSVKSNIGHSLESAGLASLVKCVLSMQYGMIPPTINLETPNPSVDWKNQPFAPVQRLVPWPDVPSQPRRAAVNAFGIGGLNAHVILDGPPELQTDPTGQARSTMSQSRSSGTQSTGHRVPDDSSAIAIIGRGVVVPGAAELSAFRQVLESKVSQLTSPPSERWRDTPFSGTRPAIRRAYEQARGGYVLDYKYDWRKHHIPPLQIETANPLQFMLLDATQQAFDESGYANREFDRMRAAVVVGTLFGGEFAHRLQIGLRLNEILDELTKVLRQHQWNEARIQQFCLDAKDHLLKYYPAIKDQTGSFTCSTQASRITKVLNVMGGAMAIDSGDCSSMAALQSAQHLLCSGVVDYVFCAAAQRDMDASAFEAWNYRCFEESPQKSCGPQGETLYPGEGVVVLMLRRLTDAIANQDQIYGIIRDVKAVRPLSGPLAAKSTSNPAAAEASTSIRSPESSELTQQFGHLQAANGLLEILAFTEQGSTDSWKPAQTVIRTHTGTCEFRAEIEVPLRSHSPMNTPHAKPTAALADEEPPKPVSMSQTAVKSDQPVMPHKTPSLATNGIPSSTGIRTNSSTGSAARIYRAWGVDESELAQRIMALVPDTDSGHADSETKRIPVRAPYRLTFVATPADFHGKRQLAQTLMQGETSPSRLLDQGIYYSDTMASGRPQLAVMFPGQGSQRSGMLSDLIPTSVPAAKMLERADRALIQRGINTCTGWFSGDEPIHENDLRSTQLAMLTADVCGYEVVRAWGLEPDLFVGHSFGEYAALVAAGALELEAAIAITMSRADAVASCVHGQGAMLSIAASVKEVRALVAKRSDLFISHCNSPRQTVVAGSVTAIAALANTVKASGFPAIQVPVGSPFHTPLLLAAESALRVALTQHRWRPPRIPVLSSVTSRFVSDRQEMIDNLAKQLTLPLDWLSCIERLLSEDVQVFVEVGPGRVLSKLTQQVIGARKAFAIALDDPSVNAAERQLRIQALLETVGIQSSAQLPPIDKLQFSNPAVTALTSKPASFEVRSEILAPAPAPQTLAVEPEEPIVPAENASSEDALAEFLTNVIVEQTGYPRDIIEFDWDLEADLGIDSIRKAMILGELREFFDLEAEFDRNVFQELRTLRDILELLRRSPGKGDWLQTAKDAAQPLDDAASRGDLPEVISAEAIDAAPVVLEPVEPVVAAEAYHDFLIDFVVERTGYPRDVIELDSDLEADLGIDSIAKAQLVGEVRDHFHLALEDAAIRAALSDLRTLRQLQVLIEQSQAAVATVLATPKLPVVKSPEPQPLEKREPKPIIARAENGVERHRANVSSTTADSPVISGHETELTHAYERGQAWGLQHRLSIQNRLFEVADNAGIAFRTPNGSTGLADDDEMTSVELAELKGVAAGAEVHPQNIFSIRNHFKLPLNDSSHSNGSNGDEGNSHSPTNGDPISLPAEAHREPASFTQRFQLEMSPAETRTWSGERPEFCGGAIVLGDQPECDELVKRLETFGIPVSWIRRLGSQSEALAALDQIWKSAPSPHLFVLTPRDGSASTTFAEAAWKQRRETGVTSLYWFCQRWLQLVEQAKLLDDASLIGVTSLGGDFGISHNIGSAESGALAGLLKAIVIETWVNGYRTLPVKILDFPANPAPNSVADALCVEMTEPSYDVEIGWNGTSRSVLRSIPAPIAAYSRDVLNPSGNWIVTGGARGITAYVVKQMALKYPHVHFHLVGTAPAPSLTDQQRKLAQSDPARLRAEVMQQAKAEKRSPLKAWQVYEKAIEIDRSLSEFRAAGIQTSYHSCDVADRSKLSHILEDIRQKSGPIAGVIHGAGIGKDASFQKKDPSMVEQCLAAKLDGALNLMALTTGDPLQAFIAFGSISGRFGANGHTDYSMANDMLAKLMCWRRNLHPAVPTAVFHWHAWDDIGMATKPETRLALEMIGMKLMPAKEGAAHFLRELRAGLPLTEVLITDTRYYRMFYPADRMLAQPVLRDGKAAGDSSWPMITSSEVRPDGQAVSHAVLHPVTDPFLREHRFRDRPLLPMVIMTELLAEAASSAANSDRPTVMRDLDIVTSLKFPTDSTCEVRMISQRAENGDVAAELRADFYSRNGKLVNPNRLYAKANFGFGSLPGTNGRVATLNREYLTQLDWKPAQYPPAGSDFYAGGPLQCMRKFALDLQNHCIWGRISAPSLSEFAGPQRDVSNWLTPSAVLDATLFTSGILAWTIRPGVSLPQRVKSITFYRCPRPAEICWMRSDLVGSDATETVFDITVWGSDQRPIFVIHNYVAGWVPE